MPYKSQAQQGYFHAHRDELEAQGVDVSEWDAASRGMTLPKKIKTPRSKVAEALAGK